MVLGRNGTGKSNLLEALLTIFGDLDLGRTSDFKYRITYECTAHLVVVDCTVEPELIEVTPLKGGVTRRFTRKQFAGKAGASFRPSHVFGYYSGQSDRFSELFADHQERFYNALLRSEDPPLRSMFLARPRHSIFVLLAFLSDSTGFRSSERLRLLREDLRIDGIDSVLFVLHRPSWALKASDLSDAERAQRDWRFWGAKGTVKRFLGALHELALAPLKLSTGRGSGRREFFFLYLRGEDDVARLRERSGANSPAAFFSMLESTDLSDLLEDVRIKVRVRGVDESLTFRELSEGEQQLLTVLGLIEFTRQREALFLLDEPDTHLNPAWSVNYTELLRNQMDDDAQSCQVIVATHDPLAISMLKREATVVIESVESSPLEGATAPMHYRSVARHPATDPQGMGVAGILTSELFGLRTTIDAVTMGKIDRRLELSAETERTVAEQSELKELTEQLADLGFNYEHADPYQEAFSQALAKRYRDVSATMTREQRRQLDEDAVRLLDEILDGERGDTALD
jgi:predicted ATPase